MLERGGLLTGKIFRCPNEMDCFSISILSSFQSAETLMIGLTKWKQLSIRPHILPPEADRLLMIQVKNRPLPYTCYTGIVPVIGARCVSVKHSLTKAKPLLTLFRID